MSDRFKFRVAIRQEDSTYKRYQADVIGWVADKLYAKCAIPDNIIRSVTITDVLIDGKNAILEQYTGLTDKNDKLIFAGDVVRNYFFDGSFMDGVVFYNELQCRWFIKSESQCALDSRLFLELNTLRAEVLEIIGNVHEMEIEQ